MPTPTYVPLFPDLTQPIAEPASPPKACLFKGAPAVCVLDGLGFIEPLRSALEECNIDRAASARITTLPTVPPKP